MLRFHGFHKCRSIQLIGCFSAGQLFKESTDPLRQVALLEKYFATFKEFGGHMGKQLPLTTQCETTIYLITLDVVRRIPFLQ